MALSGKNVYVVWTDPATSPITLGANSTIFAYGDNIYITWTGQIPFAGNNLSFIRSTNNGATFDDVIKLSGVNLSKWGRYSNNGIFFSSSRDGGTTFTKPIILGDINITKHCLFPTVAASGNNVYVAWYEWHPFLTYALRLTVSTNDGAKFQNATWLSNVILASPCKDSPGLVITRNNTYAVWTADTSQGTRGICDTYARKSFDNSTMFDSIIKLSNNPSPISGPGPFSSFLWRLHAHVQVSLLDNNLYVVWGGSNDDHKEIYLRRTG